MDKKRLGELWRILSSATNIDKLEYDEAVTIGHVFGQMKGEIERLQEELNKAKKVRDEEVSSINYKSSLPELEVGDRVEVVGNHSQRIRHFEEVGTQGKVSYIRTGLWGKGGVRPVEAYGVSCENYYPSLIAREDLRKIDEVKCPDCNRSVMLDHHVNVCECGARLKVLE